MSTLTNPVAVPPLRGIHWISEGFTLVFHSPVGWLSVMSIWFFFALLCSIFWGFGPVLFSLTLPIFFAGLMVGCRHISAGRYWIYRQKPTARRFGRSQCILGSGVISDYSPVGWTTHDQFSEHDL
ncbi:MAG: hypothetical protein B7X47_08280 [Ferrovum sp. 34-44-207]|nr:MAG: hypothetical protein B7X47_08280 [Ferrovum sp. 34-44-207]